MGQLLKQAAGNEAPGSNAHWYDAPTRQLFQDILAHNQHYLDEVNAADRTLSLELYTPQSYASKTKMDSMVSQLQSLLQVDQKYASLDSVFKMLEGHVQAADTPQSEKDFFLKGFRTGAAKKNGSARRNVPDRSGLAQFHN